MLKEFEEWIVKGSFGSMQANCLAHAQRVLLHQLILQLDVCWTVLMALLLTFCLMCRLLLPLGTRHQDVEPGLLGPPSSKAVRASG